MRNSMSRFGWDISRIAILLCFLSSSASAWPIVYRSGVTVYSPTKAYNCYTLFAPLAISPKRQDYFVYLINMSGDVVHKWTLPHPPVSYRLYPNGHLIVTSMLPDAVPGRPGIGKLWMGGTTGQLTELDWDGKVVFQHKDLAMHHDFALLPSGNFLYMTWDRVPPALMVKVRGGVKGSENPGGLMFNDGLVEVNRKGQVVWRWHANEHMDTDKDIVGPLYSRKEWSHANSIDLMPDGNILMAARSIDCIMIIDRKTGKIAWRWGSSSYLDRKTGRVEQRIDDKTLHGPHDVQLIPQGLPGAGHVSVFDNRATTGDFFFSRVVEIDLKTNRQVEKPGQAFLGRRQFSDFLGSAQRLPNGNIAICDGANGHFYQMTPDKHVAWEYINPYIPNLPLQGAVFRTFSYAPDYCKQFQSLPAAEGPPMSPSSVTGASTTQSGAQQASPATTASNSNDSRIFVLTAVFLVSVAINFVLWRRVKQAA